ncbi:MAG: PIN domain-containing protein [Pseudomonadota bacterium]
MAIFTALFDANVLYSIGITDIAIRLARRDVFRLRWSDEIHHEWMRTLAEQRPDLGQAAIERRRQRMDHAVPQARVTGYESLVEGLRLPDAEDRHVLAAAINGRADVIVSFNTQDLPADALKPHGIECQHPDEFLNFQMSLNEATFIEVVREARGDLTSPAIPSDNYIEMIDKRGLPVLASNLRKVRKLL